MLGISTYFKDLDYEYLKRASEIGAKYLFTSLHIPEEDLSNLDKELPRFLEKINEYNLMLVPDISPKTFDKLGIADGDYKALKEMNFKALRLDYGFEDYELVKELQKSFELILNASVVTKDDLLEAEKAGVDLNKISVMHNFYPKAGTGLPIQSFKEINVNFEIMNIKTMAFVPGDSLKRFPLYEGLPTLEKHRKVHPYIAAVELMEDYGIDDILIGDSKAEYDTLEWIESYRKNRIMHIPAYFEKDIEEMYDKIYKVRRDTSESMV
ncbi:MAG: MupG family TIM beta-alpha barrel fold protein, partial [Atopostipes suicloacalis]|nr:MupG family TIM beta-alpha barrel fold protein [Atopostipes suicloacalis]